MLMFSIDDALVGKNPLTRAGLISCFLIILERGDQGVDEYWQDGLELHDHGIFFDRQEELTGGLERSHSGLELICFESSTQHF